MKTKTIKFICNINVGQLIIRVKVPVIQGVLDVYGEPQSRLF